MRSSIFALIILMFSISQALALDVKCLYKKSESYAADELFGLKCDPLESIAVLKHQGYNTRCECLQKGEKFTRIKQWFFEKNRKGRADKIQLALEKKTAEAIRAQIDQGFKQSLKLDALLKQSVINTSLT